MTQQYMLLFSLGPVQSFIAQARKTRDLWLGSLLLSALMKASMQDVKDKLIYPSDPTIRNNIPDLPNKYIAIFPMLQEAEQAAKQSEQYIVDNWNAISKDVWDEVLGKVRGVDAETLRLWQTQIEPANLFEFYWVVVAGDDEDKRYKDWLTETQTLFDRRKHLRNFEQQLEIGEKSTISGQRAALRGAGEWRTDVQTFWYNVAKQQSLRDISKDGTERLDAVDTVKRFAHLSDTLAQLIGHKNSEHFKAGFPSTSSIATASFIEQLLPASESGDVASALSKWLRESSKLNDSAPATIPLLVEEAKRYRRGGEIVARDGDCCFPETYSARRLEKEFGFVGEERRPDREQLAKNGPEAVQKLLRATDALTPPITRPTPYYAMIQMDGDKMGRLINGVGSREEHQKISGALSDFSRENVPRLVEERYPGRLIYAGGDDVFALAPVGRDDVPDNATAHPIKNVLNLAHELQAEYHNVVVEAVKDTLTTDSKDESTKSRKELVTASTGIAIAHHYTSLSYVRRVSKEAEQLAKNTYGRNALVVTVLRRSGEQTRVGCRWSYKGLEAEAQQPIQLFSDFYDLFVEDVLSPKCVHTLLEEAPTLVFLEPKAQVSEIKRVLMRQRDPAKKERFKDGEVLMKAEYLVKLAEAMDAEDKPDKAQGIAVELHAEKRRYGLVEVLGWLLVMLFLARKEQE